MLAKFIAMAVAFAMCAGCGYVGEPLPPALNIPRPVVDLRAVERGDKLIIAFTIPDLTTEDLVIKELGAVELRGGPAAGDAFNADTWSAAARAIPVGVTVPGPVNIEAPLGDWQGKEIVLGVRLRSFKGRVSAWSNLLAIPVPPALPTPADLAARATAGGVQLTWSTADARPGLQYRIFRRDAKQQEPSLAATVDAREWTDATAEFDQPYAYLVQAVIKAGGSFAESEVSAPVVITPADAFPPAAPSGLMASPGLNAVELAWSRNTESDFQGYRVYRAEANGEWARIADALPGPSYSDSRVEAGRAYRYTVTAVDRKGNESPRSAEAAITLQ